MKLFILILGIFIGITLALVFFVDAQSGGLTKEQVNGTLNLIRGHGDVHNKRVVILCDKIKTSSKDRGFLVIDGFELRNAFTRTRVPHYIKHPLCDDIKNVISYRSLVGLNNVCMRFTGVDVGRC